MVVNTTYTRPFTAIARAIPYVHSTCTSYVLNAYLYCVYALVGGAISIRDPYKIYTTLIQLMSIAGYEAYVCVCFFMYKTVCAALIIMAAVGRPYVCLKCNYKKVLKQERKTFLKMNKK